VQVAEVSHKDLGNLGQVTEYKTDVNRRRNVVKRKVKMQVNLYITYTVIITVCALKVLLFPPQKLKTTIHK